VRTWTNVRTGTGGSDGTWLDIEKRLFAATSRPWRPRFWVRLRRPP